jgi:hypothetical protein
MFEGPPGRTLAVAAGAAATSGAIGAGWIAAAAQIAARLPVEVQVVALQLLALMIITGELGLILLAWESVHSRPASEALPPPLTSPQVSRD